MPPPHPLGRRVRLLFPDDAAPAGGAVAGIGSVLLVPELLSKPLRDSADEEVDALAAMLGRLDLRPVDATHLATAVIAGADRFITDNSSDFPTSIPEIDITYPQTLPER